MVSRVIILVFYFLFYAVALNSSKAQFWKHILGLKWQIMFQYVIKRKWNNDDVNWMFNCCPLSLIKTWLGSSPRGHSVIESYPTPRKPLHIDYQAYHKHVHATYFVFNWAKGRFDRRLNYSLSTILTTPSTFGHFWM